MANTLITPSIITKQALVEFKNAMVMLMKVDRQLDSQFANKIGDTINVRRRVMYSAIDGPNITGKILNTIEGNIPVQLDKQKTVPIQFTTKDLTLTIEDFSERYIRPAMIELVQQVESEIAEQYKKIWNFTGTPGTTPSTFLQIGDARAILTENGVPSDTRAIFYTPAAITNLADGLKGVFPTNIAETAIEEASIGRYAGFQVIESASLKTHTVGVNTGTPLIDGAAQNVTYLSSKDGYSQSLVTKDWTNSVTDILLAGDIFTIANVFSVNPRTRVSTGRLQNFVVLVDATSGASTGPATLSISPPIIIPSGGTPDDDLAYQTVDAAPADNAVITVKTGAGGTQHPQNLGFHKNAITVAFAQLEEPEGGANFSRQNMDGVSILFVEQFDILLQQNIKRFDILFGVEAQNPGMAIRHTG